MSDPTKDFLGSGWKFPPRLDARGHIELVQGEQDVAEAIRIILMTRRGERPMRPEFGSRLHTLVFEGRNDITLGLARQYVSEALERWEPRIEVMAVTAYFGSEASASLLIEVAYRIRATNSERNLTFPYYIIPGED